MIAFVGELGVGDGDFAAAGFEQRARRRVRRGSQRIDASVDRGVNAADEKARDAGDCRQVQALLARLPTRGRKSRRLLHNAQREQQRDVDVDPFGEQRFDGGQTAVVPGTLISGSGLHRAPQRALPAAFIVHWRAAAKLPG